MKRSELQNKIAGALCLFLTSNMHVDEGAGMIIDLLDELMMRPPSPGGDLAGIIDDGNWEPESELTTQEAVLIPEDHDPQF